MAKYQEVRERTPLTNGPFIFQWHHPRREDLQISDEFELVCKAPIESTVTGLRQMVQTSDTSTVLDGLEGPPHVARLTFAMKTYYQPLQVPHLHRRFANLDLDASAIADFIGQYGFLGRHIWDLTNDASNHDDFVGESVAAWKREIRTMKTLISILDATKITNRETRTARLDDLIQVNPKDGPSIKQSSAEGPFLPSLIPSLGFIMQSKYNPVQVTLVQGAKDLLQDQINGQFAEWVRPALTLLPKDPVFLIPKDLLAAMYVQLALEIQSDILQPYSFCPVCATPFTKQTAKTKYCSDSCKFKHYRANKKARSEAESG